MQKQFSYNSSESSNPKIKILDMSVLRPLETPGDYNKSTLNNVDLMTDASEESSVITQSVNIHFEEGANKDRNDMRIESTSYLNSGQLVHNCEVNQPIFYFRFSRIMAFFSIPSAINIWATL